MQSGKISFYASGALILASSLYLNAAQMGALSSSNYGSSNLGGTVYQELPANGSHKIFMVSKIPMSLELLAYKLKLQIQQDTQKPKPQIAMVDGLLAYMLL